MASFPEFLLVCVRVEGMQNLARNPLLAQYWDAGKNWKMEKTTPKDEF
jgi:hypothetical protein